MSLYVIDLNQEYLRECTALLHQTIQLISYLV